MKTLDQQLKDIEILEKQRADNAKAYAFKIRILQDQEIKSNENIKNLDKVIADHVASKQKELDDKIAATEKIKLEAITMKKEAQNLLYESQAKKEQADTIYESMLQDAEAHEQKVKDHVDTVSSAHTDIDKRHGECSIRESKASDMSIEANKKFELAIVAEQKAQSKIDDVIKINEAIREDIEIQKDLYFKNKQTLDAIIAAKSEVDVIKAKADADMAEVIKIRDSLDAAQARIERNSQELVKRNEECQAREIQNKVSDQILKDRKVFLDGQEGKLNELKNNVMTLKENLEKKQAIEPKEGV